MPDLRASVLRLLLVAAVALAAGCRYSGPYVQTRVEVKLTYAAEASTTVYKAQGKIGEYRFERFEGEANAVLEGGSPWDLDANRRTSSRAVAQPFSGKRVVLKPRADGRVEMNHGRGPTSVLRFVTGSWKDYSAGRHVVMRLDEASWQSWIRATENAVLDVIDGYRKRTFPLLDRNQDMTEGRVLDLLVDEKPLVRANRQELMVFFESVRIEGGFEITTRRKDPRYRWWSYQLRPEVSNALASVAEVTVAAAIVSLEFCGHCVKHWR